MKIIVTSQKIGPFVLIIAPGGKSLGEDRDMFVVGEEFANSATTTSIEGFETKEHALEVANQYKSGVDDNTDEDGTITIATLRDAGSLKHFMWVPPKIAEQMEKALRTFITPFWANDADGAHDAAVDALATFEAWKRSHE